MLRKSPQRTAALLAANRANSQKSTGPRTPEGKQRSFATLKRHFARLLGVPETMSLDQEPGDAIRLYRELIAPYEPAPPLLAMHFRDLARLHLELEAWEGIRDANMEYRLEKTRLEERRLHLDMNRDVAATAQNTFDTGLETLPDSFGKFNAQCICLAGIKGMLERGEFARLVTPLERLYGRGIAPATERGKLIGIYGQHLMKLGKTRPAASEPGNGTALDDDGPGEEDDGLRVEGHKAEEEHEDGENDKAREEYMLGLTSLVTAEEHDVQAAWGLALDEKRMTLAARRSRLTPTHEDHWMNRQGDRLRQAIDRKIRLTSILLKTLGLASGNRPCGHVGAPESDEKTSTPVSRNVESNQQFSPKRGARPKAGMSFGINKRGATSKARKRGSVSRNAL